MRAVLACEDGSFYRHGGFRLDPIRDSIAENIKDRRFSRGASTISMQLTKNLFLDHGKNISRKLQEFLLTYAVEQELDKKRMLEIYMNVIEWGPGIYGVGGASRHYFRKSPSELTPLEAAFMASIIPNPVRYHSMFVRGYVSDAWADYLEVIVSKMHVDEPVIDDSPYKLVFGGKPRGDVAGQAGYR